MKMEESMVDSFIDHLRDRVGDSIRVVVPYEGTNYEVEYIRDDVADEFTPEEFHHFSEELLLEVLGESPDAYPYSIAELRVEATARWFREAVLVNVPYAPKRGIGITFDRDASVSVQAVVETTLDFIEAEVLAE